ncbi:MAG: PAS domain S-box protein [Syntrophotaleaceae bacterium]
MKKVLVIEGSGRDSNALQKLLQDHGYSVRQTVGKGLQVSEVFQNSDRDDENVQGETPLATFRSSLDGKLYGVVPAAGDIFEITKPPQGVEQHFRGIYEKGPLGIFRSSLDGRLLNINPAGALMLKYGSPREMIETVNRTNIGEALYLDPGHRQKILAEVLASKLWHVSEERFRCKDGSIIDCKFHMRVVSDVDGQPLELEGFLEDISERKRTERALLFTQFAIDKTIDQAFWVNMQGRFVYVNDAASYVLGYSKEELAGMSIFDIDPDCNVDFYSREWQELKRHCSKTFERRHRARDGRVYPVEVRANYLVYEGREYLCLFATDISERKRKDQTLRFTQFAIDNSIDQAFWSDEDGRFVYVNDAACRALGYSRKELLQMSVPDIARNFSAGTFVAHQRELKEKGSLTFETLHRAKDGRGYPVEIRANYVVFDGKPYTCAFATDISERKRTEETLTLSQVMIDAASMGIFRGSDDARILAVNDYWARKLGYTPAELCSMTLFDLDPSLTQESWREHRKILTATGSNTFESAHRRKDGTEIPVEVTINLFKYRDRVYSCSFAKDISERRQAEKIMRQANLVLENSPAVLFRWQAQPGWPVEMVTANVVCFGYTPEELLSGEVPFASIVYPADLERVAVEVETYANRGEDRFKQEYRIVTKQGEVRWVDDSTVVERNAEGQASHYQGILIDITERKQAEEKRRLSEERLQSLFRVAPAGMGVVCDRIILEVNQRVCDMTGYAPEELIGNSARMLYPSQQEYALVGKEKYAQIESAGIGSVETRWLQKDGNIIDVLLASAPLNPSDLSRGFAFTALDITDRKRTEEALHASERKYRSIVEHAPFGITRSTKDGKLLSVNPALAAILKYDSAQELRETVNASTIQDVLFPKPSKRAPLVEKILASDCWTVFNNPLRCKDGTMVTCRVHSRRLVDEAGEAGEFESFQENITDQLAAEQALRESEEKFRCWRRHRRWRSASTRGKKSTTPTPPWSDCSATAPRNCAE